MFQATYKLFLKLDCLDCVLLLILLFALLCKGMVEIICWCISKNFNRDKNFRLPCIYLNTQNNHDCRLLKYKEKYFVSERCNKNKCPGYRTSSYSIEEIKLISKWPFVILTACKWISELSTVLLIIRTLLKTNI